MIVSENSPVTLLGGGPVAHADLAMAQAIAPILVAADSGATTALAQGILPVAVIGDMDSISSETADAIPDERLHLIFEQDTTDFEKCLLNVSAPVLLCIGFIGDRLDHELAVFNALIKHPDRAAILIGERDVVFRLPDHLELHLPIGTRFSLFPMRETQATSQGLVWPIDGLKLAPWGKIATSNRVESSPVVVRIKSGAALAILPKAALPDVVSALSAVLSPA